MCNSTSFNRVRLGTTMIDFNKTNFIKSAQKVNQMPPDTGAEVAFAGRSNAGKSSTINCLTDIRGLAKTSKTPGRTQLLNCFALNEDASLRLIDLPGYGYAKVSKSKRELWQKHLANYFEVRQSLKLVVVLMDIRHPLTELDRDMIDWAIDGGLHVHIVLTKSDKISKNKAKSTEMQVYKHYELAQDFVTVQSFSSLKKDGILPLKAAIERVICS